MGRETGTRELLIATLPYVIVYRVFGQAVEIAVSCIRLGTVNQAHFNRTKRAVD
jgi:hypothetical protein